MWGHLTPILINQNIITPLNGFQSVYRRYYLKGQNSMRSAGIPNHFGELRESNTPVLIPNTNPCILNDLLVLVYSNIVTIRGDMARHYHNNIEQIPRQASINLAVDSTIIALKPMLSILEIPVLAMWSYFHIRCGFKVRSFLFALDEGNKKGDQWEICG